MWKAKFIFFCLLKIVSAPYYIIATQNKKKWSRFHKILEHRLLLEYHRVRCAKWIAETNPRLAGRICQSFNEAEGATDARRLFASRHFRYAIFWIFQSHSAQTCLKFHPSTESALWCERKWLRPRSRRSVCEGCKLNSHNANAACLHPFHTQRERRRIWSCGKSCHSSGGGCLHNAVEDKDQHNN